MGMLGDLTGSNAGKGAEKASKQAMAGQTQAMDYLNDYYDPIRGYKSDAMGQLAGFYGLGGQGQQGQLYGQMMQDPQYQQMVDVGQQGVLRGASATGGLRGGNVQAGLAQNSQNVLQNLVNQRLQGLQVSKI